jgi:hypothetical protein
VKPLASASGLALHAQETRWCTLATIRAKLWSAFLMALTPPARDNHFVPQFYLRRWVDHGSGVMACRLVVSSDGQ